MTRSSVLSVVTLTWCWMSPVGAASFSFQGLGDLPGGGFLSEPHDISADGSVIVGRAADGSGSVACRWTGGMIQPLFGGHYSEGAFGASADGRVIAGVWDNIPYRLVNDIPDQLATLPPASSARYYHIGGLSDDGTVAAGHVYSESGAAAYYWTAGEIRPLAGSGFSLKRANGLSADGSVIVGVGTVQIEPLTYVDRALVWRAGQVQDLGFLPGAVGGGHSEATAVSADGAVIVGVSGTNESLTARQAVVWRDGQIMPLGYLPNGRSTSVARDVSADGSVIVGTARDTANREQAVVWTGGDQMQLVSELLEQNSVSTAGWTLQDARCISADGRTIAGLGVNPEGYAEAWVATIPEPATVGMLILAVALVIRRPGYVNSREK